ncbi:hypothetical protein IWQ62_002826 [Dispira parvispora]|uniref:Arb2 domain-containing protein n=1 Tax=Dispira parvispora TaxID=1520584 RepID=A0A9W8AVA8_9FUNG|nr:hypothetical protein IWQ62_002826 [Dispira parvispora]
MLVPKRLLKPPRVQKNVADWTFPTTLEGFGLKRTTSGHFVDATGAPYPWERTAENDDHTTERFNALVEIIAGQVKHELQQAPLSLQTTRLPLGAKADQPHCLVFHTPNAFTTQDKVLVFVVGSREFLGVWHRDAVVKGGLQEGTILPYVEQALKDGYEVLVLNLGEIVAIKGKTQPDTAFHWTMEYIQQIGCAAAHVRYTLSELIIPCQSSALYFIGYDQGPFELFDTLFQTDVEQSDALRSRIRAMALIRGYQTLFNCYDMDDQEWIKERCMAWDFENVKDDAPPGWGDEETSGDDSSPKTSVCPRHFVPQSDPKMEDWALPSKVQAEVFNYLNSH